MNNYLKHPKFGNGTIINISSNPNLDDSKKQLNQYVTIQFENATKTFIYPDSLLNNTFNYIPTDIIKNAEQSLKQKNNLIQQINNEKINQNKINFVKHYFNLASQINKLQLNNIHITNNILKTIIFNNNYYSIELPTNINIDCQINSVLSKLKNQQKSLITTYFNLNNFKNPSIFDTANIIYKNIKQSKNIYNSTKTRLINIYKKIFNIKSTKTPLTELKAFEIDNNNILTKYIGESEHIRIPSGVEIIKNTTFNYCSGSIRSIIIPKTVKFIEEGTFDNCKKLLKITISQNLLDKYSNMFNNCKVVKITKNKDLSNDICKDSNTINIQNKEKNDNKNNFRTDIAA